MMKDNVR